MKLSFVIITFFFAFTAAQAQKTSPKLNAETPVSKARVIEETYPRITLNDNKCRFESLAIRHDSDTNYALVVSFARPCDREESVSITFDSLEDAVLVKDLVSKNEDYEFFNLYKDREGETSFEILYSNK